MVAEFEVVAHLEDAATLLDAVDALRPDVVVVDIRLAIYVEQ